MLAIGAVDDDQEGVTRITVHGHAWGELQGAVDAYMGHLPAPPDIVPAPGADTPASGAGDGEPTAPSADGAPGEGPAADGAVLPAAGARPARRQRTRAAR